MWHKSPTSTTLSNGIAAKKFVSQFIAAVGLLQEYKTFYF